MEEKVCSVTDRLEGNPYPGRGIVAGMSADGRCAVWAYFIMGRSDNSRNRVLCRVGDSLFTRPFDESKVKDPTLIIYRAAERVPEGVVVTNGDQTDTICEALLLGEDMETALDTRTYEPDAPNYTPRISAMLSIANGTYRYKMSMLRRNAMGDCERAYYDYASEPGVGHLIHTYQTDGNPLPSFEGAPRAIALPTKAETLADEMWRALDEDNKIALYVCYVDLQSGEMTEVLRNKYEK